MEMRRQRQQELAVIEAARQRAFAEWDAETGSKAAMQIVDNINPTGNQIENKPSDNKGMAKKQLNWLVR